MLACVLAVIALMTVMPFGGLTGLKASAEGINTNLYFDKLVSYINSYGIYSNGYKTIVNEKIDGNDTYFFAIQNKGNGIYFDLLTSSSASSYIAFNTEFVLYKTSKNISVDFLMLYYYNKRAVDSVSGVISIDRSTYTPNTKYTLNKKGAYITSTDATNSFNATLKLLCAYWDNYIYTNFGFGLEEIGFINYPGRGKPVCDTLSNYHSGHSEIRNKTEASCYTDGYTGDTYCSACGVQISVGRTIPAYGSHIYDAPCDNECNRCKEVRDAAEHTVVIDKAIAATCTKEGKTEGSHCLLCRTVIEAQTTIPKKAHTYKNSVTKATLTKNGKITSTCSVCKAQKTTTIYYPKTIKLSATSYSYDCKEKKPGVTVKDSSGKTLKNGTDYTVSYSGGRKNIGSYSVKVTFKGNYSGTKTLTYKIVLAKVTSLKASSQATTSLKLSWKKVSGASGYQIYKYDSKKKAYKFYKSTTSTSYKVSGLKAGTAYKFKVRAYKKSGGSNIYGASSAILSTATKTTAPALTVKAGSKKASLSWKKVSGATGYRVYMATSKNGSYKQVTTIKKAATVKYTKTGLTKGKTYYFKVVAYKTVDGKTITGTYSTVKSVKVK